MWLFAAKLALADTELDRGYIHVVGHLLSDHIMFGKAQDNMIRLGSWGCQTSIRIQGNVSLGLLYFDLTNVAWANVTMTGGP